MITQQRIRQLQKDGYIPKGTRGNVGLIVAVQGYIQFLKDEERRTSKSAAESRVREARAKEIELRNAVHLRELVPIEDAQAALDLVVGKVGEELGGLAARVTRDMELRRKIEAEIHGAQKRIAEGLGASANFIEKGGELPNANAVNEP